MKKECNNYQQLPEKQRLLIYGFSEEQIKELTKKKKLDTVHGTYMLVNGELILKQGKNVKKVDL